MLKLGIVHAAQLPRRRTWFGAEKFASVLLLRELAQQPAAANQQDAILRLLQMGNGTWKDSSAGRLRSIDAAVLDALRDTHRPGASLRVLDLGVASGITSVELYQALDPRFTVDFVATDLWRDALAVHSLRAGWTIVLDHDGTELQHIVGPFVLPGGAPESVAYPVNRVLRGLSRAFFLPQARAILERYDRGVHADFDTVGIGDYTVTKLPLLSAACLALCRQERNFRFATLDVLRPFGLQADVIRAMNIISPFHFGASDLQRAIGNCVDALRPGGLLIIGRSPTDDPAAANATIYVRRGTDLVVARRLNGGCEVEPLIAGYSRTLADTAYLDAARAAS